MPAHHPPCGSLYYLSHTRSRPSSTHNGTCNNASSLSNGVDVIGSVPEIVSNVITSMMNCGIQLMMKTNIAIFLLLHHIQLNYGFIASDCEVFMNWIGGAEFRYDSTRVLIASNKIVELKLCAKMMMCFVASLIFNVLKFLMRTMYWCTVSNWWIIQALMKLVAKCVRVVRSFKSWELQVCVVLMLTHVIRVSAMNDSSTLMNKTNEIVRFGATVGVVAGALNVLSNEQTEVQPILNISVNNNVASLSSTRCDGIANFPKGVEVDSNSMKLRLTTVFGNLIKSNIALFEISRRGDRGKIQEKEAWIMKTQLKINEHLSRLKKIESYLVRKHAGILFVAAYNREHSICLVNEDRTQGAIETFLDNLGEESQDEKPKIIAGLYSPALDPPSSFKVANQENITKQYERTLSKLKKDLLNLGISITFLTFAFNYSI